MSLQKKFLYISPNSPLAHHYTFIHQHFANEFKNNFSVKVNLKVSGPSKCLKSDQSHTDIGIKKIERNDPEKPDEFDLFVKLDRKLIFNEFLKN